MNFFSDRNVPYMNQGQQRQKMLITIIGVLSVIAIVVLAITLFFGDDSLEVQFERTAQSQVQTGQIADLVNEAANSSDIGNFAVTLSSVATSNTLLLSQYHNKYVGSGLNTTESDVADELASLEAAKLNGTVEDVAAQLLSAQLQDDIQQLNELEKLTTKEDLLFAIQQIREGSAQMLGELEDGEF